LGHPLGIFGWQVTGDEILNDFSELTVKKILGRVVLPLRRIVNASYLFAPAWKNCFDEEYPTTK